MAKSWLVNPKTGDYVLADNGAPSQTDSLTVPAYFRLKVKRGTWLYAPSVNYGSTFHLQKKRRSTENASLFEDIAVDALQPIVDDGRASTIAVDTTLAQRNSIALDLQITDATGKVEQLVIDPIRS